MSRISGEDYQLLESAYQASLDVGRTPLDRYTRLMGIIQDAGWKTYKTSDSRLLAFSTKSTSITFPPTKTIYFADHWYGYTPTERLPILAHEVRHMLDAVHLGGWLWSVKYVGDALALGGATLHTLAVMIGWCFGHYRSAGHTLFTLSAIWGSCFILALLANRARLKTEMRGEASEALMRIFTSRDLLNACLRGDSEESAHTAVYSSVRAKRLFGMQAPYFIAWARKEDVYYGISTMVEDRLH